MLREEVRRMRLLFEFDEKVLDFSSLISQSGVQECVEGCLSFPNRFVKTIRPQKVTIQALNEYEEEIIVEGEDEMAKCFCHELEHLDGMIFLDKAIEELSALSCKLIDAVSEKEKGVL